MAAKGYSDEVCELVLAIVTESETEAVASAVGTTGFEAESDESQTSSAKPPCTTESETACAESQRRSNKPETGTFDLMTTDDKSGTALVGSRSTSVESQSGCDILLETATTLFLAGGERTSL